MVPCEWLVISLECLEVDRSQGRNLHYVIEVETYLSRELNGENNSDDFLEEALYVCFLLT